jgi:hypothetical protein
MGESGAMVGVNITLPLVQSAAFDVFLEELATSLAQRGEIFEAESHGRVTQGEVEGGARRFLAAGRADPPGVVSGRLDVGGDEGA